MRAREDNGYAYVFACNWVLATPIPNLSSHIIPRVAMMRLYTKDKIHDHACRPYPD
jgi:hypothetical protein